MPFAPFRHLRRTWLKRRPLPQGWERVVDEWLPFAAHLEGDERARFDEHLTLFFHEKNFEGVEIEVTDAMRLIVSGVAARLSRNVGFQVYDELGSIVFYPSSVKMASTRAGPSGVDEVTDHIGALGAAHSFGTIVLSWQAVEQGLKNPDDGHDTALHELAHIIDMQDGAADGTPILDKVSAYRGWARVFSEHFEKLQRRPQRQVMDAYGATNEAEFFAVATETFFEKPDQLKKKHPDLFEQLRGYYRVDPTTTK